MSPRHFLALAVLVSPAVSPALQLDVTKDIYHSQPLYGIPALDINVPYYFSAYAYDDTALNITAATLTPPGSAAIPLDRDPDDPIYFSFSDGSDDPAIFAPGGAYPNGTYTFGLTPTQVLGLTVPLTGNNFPDAPAHADPYNADAYDASKVIVLKILPFLNSGTNDSIGVNIYDESYNYVNSLSATRTATTLTIPANTLDPNSLYYIRISNYRQSYYFENTAGTFTKGGYYSATTDIEIATLPTGAVYLPVQVLSDGRGGAVYTSTITGVTGTGPFTYSLASGSLPPGLTLGPSTGTINGTIGTHAVNTEYEFSIRASNGANNYTAPFVIPVRSNGTSGTPPVEEFGFVKNRSFTQASTASLPVADGLGHLVDIFANGFSARGLGDTNVTMPLSVNFAARGRHLHRTYPLDGELLLIEYATSLAELNNSFPASANYTFNFNARTTGSVAFSSTLNSGADSFPDAPVFTGTLPAAVDPASALPLTWTLWTTGKAGSEQFIEVAVIDSATGEEVFSTDAPWDTSASAVKLAATATGVTIPAGTLETGNSYELKLTFFNVLTKTNVAVTGFNNALAIAARGTSTYLPIATIPEQSSLATWATSFNLTAGSDTFGSDPDADGLSNLVEYAFLGDPNDPTNPLATEFGVIVDPALIAAFPIKPGPVVTADPLTNTVKIRHPLRKNVADLTYTYQTSADCVTWSSVTPVSRTVIYGDTTRELVDVVLPLTPEVGKSAVFVRLKVEFTEPVGAP